MINLININPNNTINVNSPYQICTNPNDPDDKSLCILVCDNSVFDGAVIRYSKFELADEYNEDDSIDCTYEYEIEVSPENVIENIPDKEGEDFERRLGAWVIDILSTQIKHNDTKR
jgi:hypothetical protein